VSIESDANEDLAMSDEDAEGVVGGKTHHQATKKGPLHTASTPAETNTEVQGGNLGGWQPAVDDPSEDC
jgi:hypothetical protein